MKNLKKKNCNRASPPGNTLKKILESPLVTPRKESDGAHGSVNPIGADK